MCLSIKQTASSLSLFSKQGWIMKCKYESLGMWQCWCSEKNAINKMILLGPFPCLLWCLEKEDNGQRICVTLQTRGNLKERKSICRVAEWKDGRSMYDSKLWSHYSTHGQNTSSSMKKCISWFELLFIAFYTISNKTQS